ncbi:MAG: hypothetical protein QOK05_1188 [Chloroflexota bacterium]|jgi:ubiquinone/menaquinone biosynthesis C-methylase UbiE|nr:hypothetical protein [Chloroflexota bacterium]
MVADLTGRVLEVGVGTGATLPHYPAGVELTGIDLSPGMLGVARGRAEDLGISAELLEMDAQALRFPDRSFDAVVFTLCLCTIPSPAAAIREGLRVARPGAPIRFLEHVRSHLLAVALVQELVNPLTVLLQHDHFNRRTFDEARLAGVADLVEERWFLGLFTLIQGHAPSG